ncbi:MAG: hypothetical protein GXO76_11825 [Calditrichaeota bacterium]|nr:hypothetical protein [Calditrichota bacterium]
MKRVFTTGGLFLLLAGVFFSNCSKKQSSQTPVTDQTIVAKVDNRDITVHDFKLSYELFPYMLRPRGGFAAKKGQLDHMIQRILFAREAEKEGLASDPMVQNYIEYYRKQAAVKELYRKEIQSKVTVSDEEARQAYLKSLTKYHVRHLFAPTYQEAANILARLERGEDWDTIARETFRDKKLAQSGGDLGWVTWGDMDENLENTIYHLKPNEISAPVRSRWGYHILEVLGVQKQAIPSEYDFQTHKKDIVYKIRMRKERKLAGQYVKKIMEPKHVILKGKAFHYLNQQFQQIFGKNPKKLPPYMPNIFDREIGQINSALQNHLNDTLLVFKGGHWTIGDFLQRLKNVPVMDRPHYENSKKLYNDIGVMIRNETLAKIALKRGYDRHAEARKEFEEKRDDVLYSKMMMVLLDTINVTDEDVRKYYETHPQEFMDPAKVNIREILVRYKSEAEKLLREIRKGANMEKLARKYSIRTWAAEKGGEFGYFRKSGHGKIGEIAFSLKVGDLYGPLEISGGPPHGGYSIFRVIGKKSARKLPFSEIKDNLKQRLLQKRRLAAINTFSEKLHHKFYVQANYDILKKVETIDDNGTTPMFVMPIQNF